MELFIDILKVVLPATITSIATFFITKYTYNNNRPLEKLEIAYNRVYYPLFRFLRENKTNIDLIIEQSSFYFNKYDKYIDRSTLRAFQALCKCDTKAKRKTAYNNFENNIFSKNFYLRRRLGYLEPSIFQLYTYSSPSEKLTFRIFIYCSIMYICLELFLIFGENISKFSIYTFVMFFLFLILDLIYRLVVYLYYKIKK